MGPCTPASYKYLRGGGGGGGGGGGEGVPLALGPAGPVSRYTLSQYILSARINCMHYIWESLREKGPSVYYKKV